MDVIAVIVKYILDYYIAHDNSKCKIFKTKDSQIHFIAKQSNALTIRGRELKLASSILNNELNIEANNWTAQRGELDYGAN